MIFNHWSEEAAAVLRADDVPVVLIDEPVDAFASGRPRVASVSIDNAAVGRAAARELLSAGVWRTFGFVGFSDAAGTWSAKRGEAFRAALAEAGVPCSECPGGSGSPELSRWLRSLPGPSGVFAANDDAGVRVLAACRTARIPVPGRIGVLGVDDETFLCENAQPPLSSIVPNFERLGRTAAIALERMAAGAPPPRAEVGVRTIMRRASTGPGPSYSGLLVQRALAFVRQHACDGIGVPDVAERLGVSRRLLDLRFRQVQGRSVLDAIQNRRLEEVRRRLAETDDTIGEIAAACGYGDVSHLRRLFRARFHVGMRTWRESTRHGGNLA
jgi:LacI family transcriptional regulator